MLIHSVFFWLRSDLGQDQREQFYQALQQIRLIPQVAHCWIGRPAATPQRPVIVTGYDYAITVVLPDLAAHNAYQVHPVHQHFVNTCKHLWSKVQIYDAA